MVSKDIKDLLDSEAKRINSPEFIADDPVQFAHRFSDLRDIEIASLLCASIAWGNRKMICRDCNKMLALMDNDPYAYMMDKGYEELPDDLNIHRTFFARNFKHFLRGLRDIYSACGSLQDFARKQEIQHSTHPAWKLVESINAALADANSGKGDSRCLPLNMDTTALKRVNMALRWLVRNDGIVDLGVWDVIKSSQLYIPLDVHVGNVARSLELVDRKANDRKTVEQLTAILREMRPEDPVFYDFALFGIGMESKSSNS
ncbi:MAG: TIGR02757 family protein [Paramuribaculum sp.]|nr:TIGR02757 family protein [Paramuribaculum sp.]